MWPSLLSLILPSYIVVPNRELVNKLSLNSFIYAIPLNNINLPTVEPHNTTGMDILKGQNPDNYNDMRGRELLWSPNSSRDALMVSSTSSIPYYE